MRRGFSLHELLVSLSVMGVVFALATHFAVRHMRFFRQVGEVAAVKSQLGHVTGIVRSVLVNVAPASGELLVAQDSALEIRLLTGTSFVCGGTPGVLVIPVPAAPDRMSSTFVRAPGPGDRLSALFGDSVGATWLHLAVASSPASAGSCALDPGIDSTWSIATAEPMQLSPGTALRFTRPLRLSLYESSDTRWYLGAKDWNGSARQFNTIQPVAGPLLRYDDGPASGLRFTYHDSRGQQLPAPVDVGRVASVTVVP
jgi:prepilin-type N-terminal cleavage/methylation domain-containing protein